MKSIVKDIFVAKVTETIISSRNVKIYDANGNYIFAHNINVSPSPAPNDFKIIIPTPDSPKYGDSYLVNVTDKDGNSLAAISITFNGSSWVYDGTLSVGETIRFINLDNDKTYYFDSITGLTLMEQPTLLNTN